MTRPGHPLSAAGGFTEFEPANPELQVSLETLCCSVVQLVTALRDAKDPPSVLGIHASRSAPQLQQLCQSGLVLNVPAEQAALWVAFGLPRPCWPCWQSASYSKIPKGSFKSV